MLRINISRISLHWEIKKVPEEGKKVATHSGGEREKVIQITDEYALYGFMKSFLEDQEETID